MYIKSMSLDGFKSYSQRTVIKDFDPQFNAVTGLNGSGKSNILDGICFVLGISNLSHVRANNLQDLIYKCGQSGVNKATVSITFDNTNPEQCPLGYENNAEITVTRQIMMGNKNKYWVNGAVVPNKKVQDLFCSVQLNVNNPHFLIMQGKVTKVLNMKSFEILGMVEEAAGTKMYEVKKNNCKRTIEKKEAKLIELKAILDEEITPKLEKFRSERAEYLKYKTIEQELEQMLHQYKGFQYFSVKRSISEHSKACEAEEAKIQQNKDKIESHKELIVKINDEVEELSEKTKNEGNETLLKAESDLKEVEKLQAKQNAKVKAIKDNISSEEKKKKQLQKNLSDDERALQAKEKELDKVKALFEKLKETDEADSRAFIASQKRFEALSAGMELNEEGEAETLLEQLMNAREEATKASTESKQASMRLDFCKKQLSEKQKKRTSGAADSLREKQKFNEVKREIENLEREVQKLKFDGKKLDDLQNRRKQLNQEIRNLREKIDNFEAQKPYAQFKYRDPEPNFNKNKVFGVVCRLISVKDAEANVAIETAAGGRLYNVVIDSEVTGKKLLEKGDLQLRTTFIPINKIQGKSMNDSIVNFAQETFGRENVQPALAYLNYDKKLKTVMEFIFGNVFVCKDIQIATQVAFHNRIKKRCVTLDGDVVDPAGTLSGGAPQKGGSLLAQLNDIQKSERDLNEKEQELQSIEDELRILIKKQIEFNTLKKQIEIKEHECKLLQQKLENTSQYKQEIEIQNFRVEIGELETKIRVCKENEQKALEKARELDLKANTKGGREAQIKEAEREMKKLKSKSDASKKEWKLREQDYQTFNLEIAELKQSIVNIEGQINASDLAISEFNVQLEELLKDLNELNERACNCQSEVKREKSAVAQKNKEIQKKIQMKDSLQAEIHEFELKIKEHTHDLSKVKDDLKHLKAKLSDCEKKINVNTVQDMPEEEGKKLEKRIKKAQEMKNNLARTVNNKAQTLLDHYEKEYEDVKRKRYIVEEDKKKILQTIESLDKTKEEILKTAYDQITKDFGSIFSTLLPGANAKLVPPTGQTIFQGLEVKVALGDVWKESLTELSGGQRSLAALSLILAMLLFKPAPLYILDEVDAALDASHTQNIGNMLKTHFKASQFLIVSLKDGMFNNANVLFKTQFIDGKSAVTRTARNAQ